MQPQDLVIKETEHSFDLVIAPFDDAQASAARAEQGQFRGQGGEVFEGEVEALLKFFDVMGFDDLLGFDVVDLRQFGLRLGQAS
ncbi:hypothetical protein D3C85_962350 [compost metagenome]